MLTIQIPEDSLRSMPRRKTKGTLGGWRPGAGRKPELRNRMMLTISLEGDAYAALSALAEERGVSLAAVVREAVGAYVVRRRKG